MRSNALVLLVVAFLACGAAAPKKLAEKPASQPANRDQLMKDLRMGMTEAEATGAMKSAGVQIVERVEISDAIVLLKLSDFRKIGFKNGKLVSVTRDNLAAQKAAATQPATQPAK